MCLIKLIESISQTACLPCYRIKYSVIIKNWKGLWNLVIESVLLQNWITNSRWCYLRYEILPARRDQLLFIIAFLRTTAVNMGFCYWVCFSMCWNSPCKDCLVSQPPGLFGECFFHLRSQTDEHQLTRCHVPATEYRAVRSRKHRLCFFN